MRKITLLLMFILATFSCDKEPGVLDQHEIQNEHSNNTNIIRDGKLVTLKTYDGSSITYRKINGENIFEGDIELTEGQINFLKNGPSAQKENKSFTSQKSAPNSFIRKWPNSTVNFRISFTGARTNILNSIATLEANTGIDFIERASGNYIDFIEITDPDFCGSSKIGMKGGRQEIKLRCTSQRTIIHEILHALGFEHEQTRPDRDNHIIVNWNNIDPEFRHNFDKKSFVYPIGNFDFNSIMIYSSFTGFEINPAIPSMTRRNGTNFNGGSNLSAIDITAINETYYPANTLRDISSSTTYDVGANARGDYIYITKNRRRYSLYKNGRLINGNYNYNSSPFGGSGGIDISNTGEILDSSKGYSDRFYRTVDISEGGGEIYCIARHSRNSSINLFRKNGRNWVNISRLNGMRLTVDNTGRAWVLGNKKVELFNANGKIRDIAIASSSLQTWDTLTDIGNAGNEIYVSVRHQRNNNTKVLRYSPTTGRFIHQPAPSLSSKVSNIDGSNNGTLWYTN